MSEAAVKTQVQAPRAGEAQASSGVRLEARHVCKRYGQREVLADARITIEPGEFIVIVGRSGCGKSTLLRLVAGLESASSGALYTDGQRIDGLHDDTRIMFQEARLLPWRRVLDNVLLGLPPSQRQRGEQVLAQVGLKERAGEWPARLSGGQRQRVALARALVHFPRLLLLDEPLGALDALTRIEMHRLIESLWERHRFTALLVTHDVQEAVALADRVILIEDGRIALDERIELPRPRSQGDAEFAAIEKRILDRVLGKPDAVEVPAANDARVQRLRWAV